MLSSVLLSVSSILALSTAVSPPIVNVSLSNISCCNAESDDAYSFSSYPVSVEPTGVQLNVNVSCCYPNELSWPLPAHSFLNIGTIFSNGTQGATTLGLTCPGTFNTAEYIFGGSNGNQESYSPSVEAFCGVDPLDTSLFYPPATYVSEIPEINVTASANVLLDIGTIYSNGTQTQPTLSCTCAVEYPELIQTSEMQCSGLFQTSDDPLCPAPNGISGFVGFSNMTDDEAVGCGCNYTFSFVDWSLVVGADGDVAFEYWSYIEWNSSGTGGYSPESDVECLNVTATICEGENQRCVFSAFDSASISFDTAGYFEVGGAESGCWCFSMYDVCSRSSTTMSPDDNAIDDNGSSAAEKAIGVIGWMFASIIFVL